MKCLPAFVGVLLSAFTLSAAASEPASPGEDEFRQASLTGPHTTKEMYECAIREAKASLSPKLHRAVVRDMQGEKEAEARKVASPLGSEPFAPKHLQILRKCPPA